MKNTMNDAFRFDMDARRQDFKHADQLALLPKKHQANKHTQFIIYYGELEQKKNRYYEI